MTETVLLSISFSALLFENQNFITLAVAFHGARYFGSFYGWITYFNGTTTDEQHLVEFDARTGFSVLTIDN